MTRRTPWSRAASRTLSVPPVFVALLVNGSCTERGDRRQRRLVEDDLAAGDRALDRARGSRMSASISSTSPAITRRFVRRPVAKLSSTRTLVAAPQQRRGEVRADEPGAAGDEDPGHARANWSSSARANGTTQ